MQGHRPRRSARSILSIGSLFLVSWVVVLGLTGLGCRDEVVLPVDLNAAPETVITGAPGDSQTAFYRVQVFWHGSDKDGEIAGFEWAITESLPDPEILERTFRENYTTRNDSTFVFPVEANREILASRFYVRAIDNEGKRDPSPAFTFFAVRNTCAPEVTFHRSEAILPGGGVLPIRSTDTRVPTDTVPAGATVCFSWSGFDCDVALNGDGTIDTVGSVRRYLYHLSPLELVDVPGTTLADTVACYGPGTLRSQAYFMFVRAEDDAGFAGLDPAVRSFVYNFDPITRFERILPEGATDSVEAIEANIAISGPPEWVPVADGDTLDVREAGIDVRARVRAFDPDDPEGLGTVVEYQARVIEDTGFWTNLSITNPVHSRDDLFTERVSTGWKFQARSRDRLDRVDGSPAEVRFYINRAARFQEATTIGGIEFVQQPAENGVVRIPRGTTSIPVSILAVDPDPLRGFNRMEYRYKFDAFVDSTLTVRGGPPPPPWSSASRGDNTNGIWTGTVALHTGAAFYPGSHVLWIEGREFLPSSLEATGTRPVVHRIHFRIEYE